ncbi:MAG: D-glycerate dehydrogenase [Anaerolineales bacterium]
MSSSQLPLVLITHSLPESWLSSLQGKCRTIVGPVDATKMDSKLIDHLPQAEGLFTLLTITINESILHRTPNLKVVSNMAVGVDNIDIPACTRRGIPVGNTPGVLTEGTADLTMAILLATARRLIEASKDARQGRWNTWSPTGWLGSDLNGKTLGIIGLGKIGSAVAQRAHAFGMKIIYTDPNTDPILEKKLNASRVSLDDLLQSSDFVSLHIPLTPKTRGLIDKPALRKMKSNAILINASRGAVVVTDDLHRALSEGWIKAAALDVTDPEPLPPDHPLYALDNCLIVPHIGSATQNTRRRMAELACDNLLAGLDGRPLPNCVNPDVYAQ